ncbi:MAG TPA: MFS transporter [Pyrinomonadaceae bacterium]|jgi:PAT family beta-lactamase induction signal transducer AmpG
MGPKIKSLLRLYANRRVAAVLLLGFSSGLPFLLTSDTLQAWMHDLGFEVGVIGFFSLVTLPYSLKLLWSPLMDRYVPPFLGRRRGWILLAQLMLVASTAALAFAPNPFLSPVTLFILALLVAFFSASQDIVVDAYRAEVLSREELGPGASCGVLGFQAALLVSGGVALFLADHLPGASAGLRWRMVYLLMAAVLLAGVATTLLAPEPQIEERPPRTFRDAVVLPFFEFFSAKGALEIALFILLYKLGPLLATGLTIPFLRQLGFANTDVAEVNKGLGLLALIVGTLLGGALIPRLGLRHALLIFGLLQGLALLAFTLLAHLGQSYRVMVFAILTSSFCSGMGTAAYIAFLMSICNRRFTATQYAFFTSLLALARTMLKTPSGYLSAAVGWESYFLISALACGPGLLLLMLRYKKWEMSEQEDKPGLLRA